MTYPPEQTKKKKKLSKQELEAEKKKYEQELAESSKWFGQVLDGSKIVMATLTSIAGMTPLPYLKGSAAMLLLIISMIQTKRDNTEDLLVLLHDITDVFLAINEAHERMVKNGQRESSVVEIAIVELHDILMQTKESAEKVMKIKAGMKLLYGSMYRDRILQLRARVQHFVTLFHVRMGLGLNGRMSEFGKYQISPSEYQEMYMPEPSIPNYQELWASTTTLVEPDATAPKFPVPSVAPVAPVEPGGFLIQHPSFPTPTHTPETKAPAPAVKITTKPGGNLAAVLARQSRVVVEDEQPPAKSTSSRQEKTKKEESARRDSSRERPESKRPTTRPSHDNLTERTESKRPTSRPPRDELTERMSRVRLDRTDQRDHSPGPHRAEPSSRPRPRPHPSTEGNPRRRLHPDDIPPRPLSAGPEQRTRRPPPRTRAPHHDEHLSPHYRPRRGPPPPRPHQPQDLGSAIQDMVARSIAGAMQGGGGYEDYDEYWDDWDGYYSDGYYEDW